MNIPRIIHQTWKDEEIPERWVDFQKSWQINHPDWEYRLWTDDDNEQLIRRHYAWFWPIYDGYDEVIKKVDAARYFILHRHGGMYVDLDFECLRPLDELLSSRRLAIGLEPASHAELSQAVERSLDKILCNAFMASTLEHPFWEHVFKGLIQYHRQTGPLDATGPFLLTRVYDGYPHRQEEDLISADAIYPATKSDCWEGRLDDASLRKQICAKAYAVHHWHGTWWKDDASNPHPLPIDSPEQAPLHLMLEGRVVLKSQYLCNVYRQLSGADKATPRISCMLVTKGRAGQAQCAIQCFRDQTYCEKELVIVEDDTDSALWDYVASLDDQRIKFVKLPPESKPLGELRNLAVEHATGSYVAQWDDDDLYHPDRLRMQMDALQALSADASFLLRHTMWWPHSNRLAYARPRIWEGTMLCAKDKLPAYPEHRRGEDTVVVMELTKTARIAFLDVPQLYIYICHDQNTFEPEHFEDHWEAATTRIQGVACAEQLRLLEEALPIQPYLKACELARHAHT